ncbi:MAG: flavodoxin family protein [Pseudomonadota bacterium]
MKKLLGIIGSPRKLGNSEILVKAISREIGTDHDLSLLRLSDFRIMPCIGCYQCLFKGKCVLDDDMGAVIDALADCDAFILAVPTYFLGANARLKDLLDRGLSFYARAEQLWHKPSVAVGIAGIAGKEGCTRLEIHRFQKIMLSEVKATRILYGALPGEVFLSEENRQAVKELATALIGPAEPPTPVACPLCGGDTFRFLDTERVRCMLCSNPGRMVTDGGVPRFEIDKTGHDLFFADEIALAHQSWLMDMKERFLKNKAQLKEISGEYRKDGHWIKPAAKETPPA